MKVLLTYALPMMVVILFCNESYCKSDLYFYNRKSALYDAKLPNDISSYTYLEYNSWYKSLQQKANLVLNTNNDIYNKLMQVNLMLLKSEANAKSDNSGLNNNSDINLLDIDDKINSQYKSIINLQKDADEFTLSYQLRGINDSSSTIQSLLNKLHDINQGYESIKKLNVEILSSINNNKRDKISLDLANSANQISNKSYDVSKNALYIALIALFVSLIQTFKDELKILLKQCCTKLNRDTRG